MIIRQKVEEKPKVGDNLYAVLKVNNDTGLTVHPSTVEAANGEQYSAKYFGVVPFEIKKINKKEDQIYYICENENNPTLEFIITDGDDDYFTTRANANASLITIDSKYARDRKKSYDKSKGYGNKEKEYSTNDLLEELQEVLLGPGKEDLMELMKKYKDIEKDVLEKVLNIYK